MNFIKKSLSYFHRGIFFSHLFRHVFFFRGLYKIFNVLLPFIRIKPHRIFCDHFAGKGYADNPKYIAEKLHKKHPEFEIFFVYDKEFACRADFPDFIKTVPICSFRHLFILASSKFWICDYRPLVHIHKRRQFYIQTWHASIGTKKSEKDSENELPKFYVKNAQKDSKQIDLCIVGSEQMYSFHRNLFWYNGEILKSGCPRSDILFDLKKSAEIRKTLGFENKKICIYAPTFRNEHSLSFCTINFQRLKESLEKKYSDEWVIILRLHPNMAESYVNDLPVFVKNYSLYHDAQELLSISDVLITDYSSIIYDFMLTGRPAFIYATDFKDYEKERGFLIDLKVTPFSISQNNDELEKKISEFDFDAYSKKVILFKNKIGSFEDGHASDRVVTWMEEK